jgi:hypothetical protein
VQVVQVVRHKALVELMQVTVNPQLFQVVELQHVLLLVVVLVVMVAVQVLLVDQVVAAATAAAEVLQLSVKEIPEALAYPIAQVSG